MIHAGIYYAPGSLKARLCLEGKRRLYAWCRERGVGHRCVGKLVVAADDAEVEVLHRLHANALACGLADVELVDAERCRELEPAVRAAAGLWSPSTGIIDSHGYMVSLLADAEDAGAMVAWRSPFEGATESEVRAGGSTVPYDILVNAAGIGAQDVARRMGYDPPPLHLVKGSYFRLARPSPFNHLIYPVPASASLGVHLTPRSRRRRPLRPRPALGRPRRLPRRPRRRPGILPLGPPLLARPARRCPRTRLRRRPGQGPGPGRADARLGNPRPRATWCPPCRPHVRHREPGPHRLARDSPTTSLI